MKNIENNERCVKKNERKEEEEKKKINMKIEKRIVRIYN